MEIVEGIVLKTSDYQEKSKILHIFTKEHGIIGLYLKGANNYKSSSFASSQPLSHALFNINYRQNGLSTCYKAEVIEAFNTLKIDFDKNIYVYHLFELIFKSIEGHTPVIDLYTLLLAIMYKMNDINDLNSINIYTLFFELRLLEIIGVAPMLSNCVECGSTEHIANFDIRRGGFVCEKCLDRKMEHYDINTLKALYQLYHSDLGDLDKLRIENIKELRKLIANFYLYHLGIRTNSEKFFK